MKNAFIFPGQASQYVGMGKDLYDQFDLARNRFDQANDILGIDLKKVCFLGPEEELKKTFITQPAIFVHSVVMFELIRETLTAKGVAGHSLGEYSALVAAGALSFENGLNLVKVRSELMFEAGKTNPGTMGALIGLEPEKVNKLCAEMTAYGIIQPANFNSPGQIAISGEVEVIRKALVRAKEMGALKAVELEVSGAFHSPLMEGAREGLAKAIEQTEIKDADIAFYSNVSGQAVQEHTQIKELLLKQLTSPVKWQTIMENMVGDGFTHFYEIGPGKVLKGLLKRIDRSVPCTEVGTLENMNNLGDIT